MEDLFDLNPKVSTAICVLIAYLLIDDYNTSEQNAIGNWLMLIAQTLITNASSQAVIERRVQNNTLNINSSKIKGAYSPLLYNIECTREIIKEISPDMLSNAINNVKSKLDEIDDFFSHHHPN